MGAVVVLCVLLAATAVGLVWRYRDGRVREVRAGRSTHPPGRAGSSPADGDRADQEIDRQAHRGDAEPGGPDPVDPRVLDSIGVRPGEAAATLVQFSSAFCQPCRATRRVLAELAAQLPDVAHVEVDAESHLAAVRALGVRRTPTVLVLDRHGRLVARASGLPRKAQVVAAVAPLLGAGRPD